MHWQPECHQRKHEICPVDVLVFSNGPILSCLTEWCAKCEEETGDTVESEVGGDGHLRVDLTLG